MNMQQDMFQEPSLFQTRRSEARFWKSFQFSMLKSWFIAGVEEEVLKRRKAQEAAEAGADVPPEN